MTLPTHRHIPTGSLVFEQGYDQKDLELLADGFWLSHEKEHQIIGIKAEAARRIALIAPTWRQLNDLADPESDGAITRRTEINAIRDWSNQVEAKITAAQDNAELEHVVGQAKLGDDF